VVVVDIDAQAAESVAKGLRAGLAVAADVTKEVDVDGYVAAALGAYGRIDLFHNNAGIIAPVRPITEIRPDEFDRLMAVNVRGVFLGLRAVLAIMLQAGSGAVVNTASVGALVGAAGMASYVTSKHAVLGLTRTAALEVAGSGIRVNCVCPGTTDTAMHHKFSADTEHGGGTEYKALAAGTGTPIGRVAEAEEVAAAVVWLLSDEASYVTGAAVPVDGAYTTG
jgi:NAD(P)-dependent dehydrogenase (short-subunit alcohol dehydrogenase family)